MDKTNIDNDIDLAGINFKPLSKGIGFHHTEENTNSFKAKEKKNIGINVSTASSFNKSLGTKAESLGKSLEIKKNIPTELEAFYRETSLDHGLDKTPVVEKKSEIDSSMVTRFFAWVIDFIVILLALAVTITSFWLVSGISAEIFINFLLEKESIVSNGFIFACYYVAYFTFIELNISLGKKSLKLKVVTLDGEQLSLKHTFLRSLVSLLSFFTLFLPTFMKFQDKLSDTKVIKDV